MSDLKKLLKTIRQGQKAMQELTEVANASADLVHTAAESAGQLGTAVKRVGSEVVGAVEGGVRAARTVAVVVTSVKTAPPMNTKRG